MNYISKIRNNEVLDVVNKANKITKENHSNVVTLERAVLISWWCEKGDCSFCYMNAEKKRINNPEKAKRKVNGILAEVELCTRLGWNIEFLSAGYNSFSTEEVKNISKKMYEITKKGTWLNVGITNELKEYGEEIIGVTGSVEVMNPELHEVVCPSKSLEDIGNMLDVAEDLGFKKAITIILGLGESLEDINKLIKYIKEHKIDRIIFYSLNPHKGTKFEKSSPPSSLYYSWVVSTIRINFPKVEIICGTWIDNLANIGILILSGANGITKFPLFKMFGTKYGKRTEEEIKWTERELQGTFTDINRLGPLKSQYNPKYDAHIKKYIEESLKDKY
ncbi:MAG: radical SAM protein [Methanobrevibacter sp.]|jgi:biotin synthase-like enzyme|nr:radical SAM protein [Candidatus Methanovirga aequatorialis]